MIKSLPTLIFIGSILFSIIWLFDIVGFYDLPIISGLTFSQMVFLWAIAFYLIGFAFIARTLFRYRSGFKPYDVVDLLTKVKASPVRCIPAVVEGRIIGKGVPGYYISDDLYFQDDTGILYVDYRYGLSIVDFFWAITKASKMVGQKVRIKGWYRRGPMPYIQVKELETMGGKTYKNHTKGLSYVWAGLAFLIGLGIFLLWFFVLI
jgi:heat shock protein HtpX